MSITAYNNTNSQTLTLNDCLICINHHSTRHCNAYAAVGVLIVLDLKQAWHKSIDCTMHLKKVQAATMNITVLACKSSYLLVTYKCITNVQRTFLPSKGCLTFKDLKHSKALFQP